MATSYQRLLNDPKSSRPVGVPTLLPVPSQKERVYATAVIECDGDGETDQEFRIKWNPHAGMAHDIDVCRFEGATQVFGGSTFRSNAKYQANQFGGDLRGRLVAGSLKVTNISESANGRYVACYDRSGKDVQAFLGQEIVDGVNEKSHVVAAAVDEDVHLLYRPHSDDERTNWVHDPVEGPFEGTRTITNTSYPCAGVVTWRGNNAAGDVVTLTDTSGLYHQPGNAYSHYSAGTSYTLYDIGPQVNAMVGGSSQTVYNLNQFSNQSSLPLGPGQGHSCTMIGYDSAMFETHAGAQAGTGFVTDRFHYFRYNNSHLGTWSQGQPNGTLDIVIRSAHRFHSMIVKPAYMTPIGPTRSWQPWYSFSNIGFSGTYSGGNPSYNQNQSWSWVSSSLHAAGGYWQTSITTIAPGPDATSYPWGLKTWDAIEIRVSNYHVNEPHPNALWNNGNNPGSHYLEVLIPNVKTHYGPLYNSSMSSYHPVSWVSGSPQTSLVGGTSASHTLLGTQVQGTNQGTATTGTDQGDQISVSTAAGSVSHKKQRFLVTFCGVYEYSGGNVQEEAKTKALPSSEVLPLVQTKSTAFVTPRKESNQRLHSGRLTPFDTAYRGY